MAKKYIDAERLSTEIDRRMTDNLKADSEIHSTTYFAGAAKEDYDILSIIDSLQQEQPEQPTCGYDEAYLNEKIAKATKSWKGVDVDKFMDEVRGREPDKSLEEAAEDFVWNVMENDEDGVSDLCRKLRPSSKISDFYDALAEFFIAGAEWQKKKDDEEQAELFTIVALDAAQRAKEQMMKGAEEGEVVAATWDDYCQGGVCKLKIGWNPQTKPSYKKGDKVKVIVIKEDEK